MDIGRRGVGQGPERVLPSVPSAGLQAAWFQRGRDGFWVERMKTTVPWRMALIALVLGFSGYGNAVLAAAWTCDDPGGVLGRTGAPVAVTTQSSPREFAALRAGRLGLIESVKTGRISTPIPSQWVSTDTGKASSVVFLLPAGDAPRREFDWRENAEPFPAVMRAERDPASGQVDLTESGKRVLRYNDRTVEPGAVLERVAPGNRIYARPRSDYIHPLLGPNGEELTRDWSEDHPHHRGIYWAWPEVDFGRERADLHALQRVFARPTGKGELQSGPVFAQVTAENHWLWEDREPIVREVAVIRAYRASERGRVVDLAFQFVALKEGVTLARRGTDQYGGLNVRMATPQSQSITAFVSPAGSVPRRAWSDVSGVFKGDTPSGLTLLQHHGNPDYPGDWVKYPELSWCQPTFPASGTRFALRVGQPLVLRYRLWIHSGIAPDEAFASQLWDALHSPHSAQPPIETTRPTTHEP